MVYYRKTVTEAFQILSSQGQTPYVVLGDFLDDFYTAEQVERLRMIKDPLPKTIDNKEIWKWAVYFVAAIDLLCYQFEIPSPEWVRDPIYNLDHPWFLFEGWRLRAWELVKTPVPFKMRNIFTGDKVLIRV